MGQDIYHNFKELKRNEKIDVDYRISIGDVGSPITIIAPHGGKIEPRTSEIAVGIARNQFNHYCFEGIKDRNNRRLHITSHKFDEPRALSLLSRSQAVVAIHACKDSRALVYPGGQDQKLMGAIANELKTAGIAVAERNLKYQGSNPNNICNRGASGQGAQLEISRGLRDNLLKIQKLCDAIHTVLTRFILDEISDDQMEDQSTDENTK